MQLPDFLSRNHPRDKEAPAWAKVLSEGMGLALEQQDIIMGQLEDVKDIASRLRSKIEHLGTSIEELKSRPQPVQEPDMSEVLSELNAAAADVDSLQASVTGPSEEAAPPPVEEPADAPTNPLQDSTVGTTTSAAGSPGA
jgi:hypothetical protein